MTTQQTQEITPVRTLAYLVALLPLAGCRTLPPPTPPQGPRPFSVTDLPVWPTAQAATVSRYLPADNSPNTVTKSDVTIRAVVLDPALHGDFYTIPLATPDGQTIPLQALGFALALDVENGTDHIIRLSGSALLVEDDQSRQLPLFRGGWIDWRRSVTAFVNAFYDRYQSAYDQWRERQQQAFEAWHEGELGPYEHAHAQYEADAAAYVSNRPVSYAEPNPLLLFEFRSQKDCEAQRRQVVAPAGYRDEASASLSGRAMGYMAILANARTAALKRIEELAEPQLLAPAQWEALRVLPGRSYRGVVLLGSGLQDPWSPPVVNVSIVDLVTKTDAAANPTERSTFQFALRRAP